MNAKIIAFLVLVAFATDASAMAYHWGLPGSRDGDIQSITVTELAAPGRTVTLTKPDEVAGFAGQFALFSLYFQPRHWGDDFYKVFRFTTASASSEAHPPTHTFWCPRILRAFGASRGRMTRSNRGYGSICGCQRRTVRLRSIRGEPCTGLMRDLHLWSRRWRICSPRPNHALQRTGHGGPSFVFFYLLRRHGPSLSLDSLGTSIAA